jgi:hypothetical protein
MDRRFIQHEVFQSFNAAGRASIAGQPKTHRGGLIGIRGQSLRLPGFGARWPVLQGNGGETLTGRGDTWMQQPRQGVRLTSDTPTAAISRP